MGYLEEILKGNYSNYQEDRLSQVFSATFNHSYLFRKTFLDLIKYKSASVKNLRAQTQINYGSYRKDCRIDIIIYQNKRPVIIIENKVNAPLTINQVKKYNNILELKRCKRIALVKHYFEDYIKTFKWKIYHWSELYSILKKILDKGITKANDSLLISNFAEHLELMNMAVVNKIPRNNLEDLALVLNKLKIDSKIHTSLTNKNFFETGNQITSVLEAITLRARSEKLLLERIGNSIKANPHFSWWHDDDMNDLRLTINVTIKVFNSTNKIKAIGTGIFFYNKNPKKYSIMTYAQYHLGGDYEKIVEYTKKDLILDVYAKQTIAAWKKWLK